MPFLEAGAGFMNSNEGEHESKRSCSKDARKLIWLGSNNDQNSLTEAQCSK